MATSVVGCCEERRRTADLVFKRSVVETTSTTDKQVGHEDFNQFSSFTTHTLCGLYTIVIVVVGFVLSLATALTHQLEQESYYLEAFDAYIYTVSIAFLIYLHVLLSKFTKDNDDVITTCGKNKLPVDECDKSRDLESLPVTSHGVTYDAPGVNFYLRLGAIGFGTGCLIQDGFRLAEYIENGENSLKCLGPLHIVIVLLHMAFTFYQTYFLFKSHKIVVHTQKAVVRFGLMHLVATNICVWFATTVTETQEDFLVTFRQTNVRQNFLHTPAGGTGAGGGAVDETGGHFLNTNISSQFDHLNNSTGMMFETLCAPDSSLSWKASPYLFPCTIEYSLIAAAVVYKMYRNVGRSHSSFHQHQHLSTHQHITATGVDCDKANKGLFVGLFVTVLTLVAVTCYFVFDTSLYGTESSSLTFFATEILLLFLLCVAVVLAFSKFQQLQFVRYTESTLDQSLLLVAVFGVFVLECFHLVSALGTVSVGDMVSVLAAGTSLLAFTQAGLQTVYIIDALHRCAASASQAQLKPGRALVTFLLLCNLSLWVVCIFEVQKAENLPIHASYYGYLPWSIISHLCVPMIIFYRFHSTVCLSDIWINAYQLQPGLTLSTVT